MGTGAAYHNSKRSRRQSCELINTRFVAFIIVAAGCPGNELPGRSQGSPFQNSQNHRASICSTRSAKMATNDNCSSSRTDLLDKKIPRPRSLVLHSYFRSSCAWRVRIALESKGLKYTYREVNIREDIPEGKQQHTDEFRALNPLSQVPVLQVYESGELVANLTQSMAIMEYIDESFSGVNLLPKDLLQRAQCRALCQLIVSGIQPIQNLGTLNKLEPDQRQEWARYFINKGFEALERMLSDRVFVTGCCISEQVTLADFCLVPQVYNARRFGVDMSRFPKIVAVDAHLATLEAFIRAHPSRQPDCPESFRKV